MKYANIQTNLIQELESYISEMCDSFLRSQPISSMINGDEAKVLGKEVYMNKASIAKKYQEQIRQLPDGRYQIRVHGKNIMLTTLDAVIDKILILEKDATNNPLKNVKTFEQLAIIWLPYRRSKVAASTFRKSCSFIENILKESKLAKTSIYSYSIFDLDIFFDYVKMKKPNITKKDWEGNIMANLRDMLDFAIYCKLPVENHLKSFSIHSDQFVSKKTTPKENRCFNDEELCRLHEIIYEDARNHKSAVPLGILIVANTGIRDGELTEIRWKDLVQQENGIYYLHIQREQVEETDKDGRHCGYKTVDHCKTAAGDRAIALNKDAMNILHMVKEYNLENGIDCSSEALIFQRIKKGQHLPCNIRCYDSRIAKYCAILGIPRKSMHDMRRTFCTRLYGICKDVDAIRPLMGHSNTRQTEAYIINLDKASDAKPLLDKLCM